MCRAMNTLRENDGVKDLIVDLLAEEDLGLRRYAKRRIASRPFRECSPRSSHQKTVC